VIFPTTIKRTAFHIFESTNYDLQSLGVDYPDVSLVVQVSSNMSNSIRESRMVESKVSRCHCFFSTGHPAIASSTFTALVGQVELDELVKVYWSCFRSRETRFQI